MKRFLTLITSLAVLLPALASAGAAQAVPVTIDLDNRTASGDQWTARSSKNDFELIGCGVTQYDDGVDTFTFGFCQASNANDEYAACLTTSPALLETMRATSAFAYISFDWNDDGDCTRVRYSTQSFYLPRFTAKGEPDGE